MTVGKSRTPFLRNMRSVITTSHNDKLIRSLASVEQEFAVHESLTYARTHRVLQAIGIPYLDNVGSKIGDFELIFSNGAQTLYVPARKVETKVAAPLNVQNVATGSVHLTWSASEGADRYIIRRGELISGPFLIIGATKALEFYDTLSPGISRFYTVSALSDNGEGYLSSPIELTLPLDPGAAIDLPDPSSALAVEPSLTNLSPSVDAVLEAMLAHETRSYTLAHREMIIITDTANSSTLGHGAIRAMASQPVLANGLGGLKPIQMIGDTRLSGPAQPPRFMPYRSDGDWSIRCFSDNGNSSNFIDRTDDREWGFIDPDDSVPPLVTPTTTTTAALPWNKIFYLFARRLGGGTDINDTIEVNIFGTPPIFYQWQYLNAKNHAPTMSGGSTDNGIRVGGTINYWPQLDGVPVWTGDANINTSPTRLVGGEIIQVVADGSQLENWVGTDNPLWQDLPADEVLLNVYGSKKIYVGSTTPALTITRPSVAGRPVFFRLKADNTAAGGGIRFSQPFAYQGG